DDQGGRPRRKDDRQRQPDHDEQPDGAEEGERGGAEQDADGDSGALERAREAGLDEVDLRADEPQRVCDDALGELDDRRGVVVPSPEGEHDYAACRACRPSANSSTIFSQKAARSSGSRLETRPLSTTTSW